MSGLSTARLQSRIPSLFLRTRCETQSIWLNIPASFSDSGDLNFRAERERLIEKVESTTDIEYVGDKYFPVSKAAIEGYES
jgi:hypothetical protein